MAKPVYVIDGRSFSDWKGLIEEFNRVLIRPNTGEWNGNLDAFYDYLYWPNHEYTLVWLHSDLSRRQIEQFESLVRVIREEPKVELRLE
jgi:hypothetical protein